MQEALSTNTCVCGLEGSRATARPGGKRKAWQRNGIHFAPSWPNPWSCSSQQLQDVGRGTGWWDHVPLSIHCGFVLVGWLRDVSQDSLSPSHSLSRASTPSPQLRGLAQDTPHPHRLLNAGNPPAPLSAPSPGSNSLFKLEPVHPNSLEAGQHLDPPGEPQSTCPSPRCQLQMSPCAFPLPFPPPYCF